MKLFLIALFISALSIPCLSQTSQPETQPASQPEEQPISFNVILKGIIDRYLDREVPQTSLQRQAVINSQQEWIKSANRMVIIQKIVVSNVGSENGGIIIVKGWQTYPVSNLSTRVDFILSFSAEQANKLIQIQSGYIISMKGWLILKDEDMRLWGSSSRLHLVCNNCILLGIQSPKPTVILPTPLKPAPVPVPYRPRGRTR